MAHVLSSWLLAESSLSEHTGESSGPNFMVGALPVSSRTAPSGGGADGSKTGSGGGDSGGGGDGNGGGGEGDGC